MRADVVGEGLDDGPGRRHRRQRIGGRARPADRAGRRRRPGRSPAGRCRAAPGRPSRRSAPAGCGGWVLRSGLSPASLDAVRRRGARGRPAVVSGIPDRVTCRGRGRRRVHRRGRGSAPAAPLPGAGARRRPRCAAASRCCVARLPGDAGVGGSDRPGAGPAPLDHLRTAHRAGRRRLRRASAGRARWGLGLVAFEIGTAYLRGEPLERAGRPVLARLCAAHRRRPRTSGCCTAPRRCTWPRTRPGRGGPTLVTEVGVRLPAALTATGLSILAHLPAEQVTGAVPGRPHSSTGPAAGPATLPDAAPGPGATCGAAAGRSRTGGSRPAPRRSRHRCSTTTGCPSPRSASPSATAARRRSRPRTECGRDFAELAGPVRHGGRARRDRRRSASRSRSHLS